MTDSQGLDKQIISQVAEISIANQLEAAEKIDIYVETDILKIVQGQADGVTFAGQGLVTKQNIRLQEIKLQTDSIDINPLNAIFGQIKLNKPVNFIARLTLTADDINHALNSLFSRKLVQKFELNVKGEVIKFALQKMQIYLHNNGQIELQGSLKLIANENTRLLGFITMVRPRTQSQPIMIESFQCTEGDGVSLDFIVSLMEKFQELANLPYFQWEDIQLNIKNLDIQQGKLILLIAANVTQLPDSSTEVPD